LFIVVFLLTREMAHISIPWGQIFNLIFRRFRFIFPFVKQMFTNRGDPTRAQGLGRMVGIEVSWLRYSLVSSFAREVIYHDKIHV
jgi:hypothetical protein